ncbi:MAG: class I SAM-dependent methyltransferase [Boseongicola sp. SB0677_bin_26]|nr:class I SAM-dependent methyltransferase [Boseongicola sp. SB0677_bin_26]
MSTARIWSSKAQHAKTLAYYEDNARNYFKATHDADLSSIYRCFLREVPKGGRILDAGSGSGRDTAAFARRGYMVEAFDQSPSLCELSTEYTGIRARVRRFQDIDEKEEFDGIWACASLLHVPEKELREVIGRLVGALKTKGVLYMSFKYGANERVAEDGRFFVDMTEERLWAVLQEVRKLKVQRVWRTLGEGKFEGRWEWLNALASKAGALEEV